MQDELLINCGNFRVLYVCQGMGMNNAGEITGLVMVSCTGCKF